jgi:hypothetical protein
MNNQSYQDKVNDLILKGMSPQDAAIIAQQIQTPATSGMSGIGQEQISKMPAELAKRVGETYPFSDEQKVYENMQALGSKMGKGTQTGGKYGVFVGDPLGAFTGGAMQTYGGMSALQNALRAKETFGEVTKGWADGDTSKSSSTVDPAYNMQAGVDTGLGAMAARNNARFNKPQQLPKPSMMPAQTYPASPSANPMQNATPYGVNGIPLVKPAGMSDEDWATIQSLRG